MQTFKGQYLLHPGGDEPPRVVTSGTGIAVQTGAEKFDFTVEICDEHDLELVGKMTDRFGESMVKIEEITPDKLTFTRPPPEDPDRDEFNANFRFHLKLHAVNADGTTSWRGTWITLEKTLLGTCECTCTVENRELHMPLDIAHAHAAHP